MMSKKFGEYVIAYYDADGNLIGYYGEDSASGGYPYVTMTIRQAESLSESAALTTAEQSFSFPYFGFDIVDKCIIGKLSVSESHVLHRKTYKDNKKQREIAERINQIQKLQREIEQLQGDLV